MTLHSGSTVGNYVLGERLGRGGMSEVFAAQHRFLGNKAAIKILHARLADNPAIAAAFVDEATRTRAIDHPNVVRIYDFGRDDAAGFCYLVMERLDGEDLATRLERDGRVGEAEVRRLGAAIAAGAAAAHARGIIHRDLKPANVMILRDGTPKLVDFGVSKTLGARAALSTGPGIGTPAYMAPEQLLGGVVAPTVDVWALGVMLFELATGTRPFEGFDDGRAPQLTAPAPRPSDRAAISPDLEDVILACLEREPPKRLGSMDELARRLRGVSTSDGIPAERETAPLVPGALRLGPPPERPVTVLAPAPRRGRWRWALGAILAIAIAAAVWHASPTTAPAATRPDAGPVAVTTPVPAAPAAPDASARDAAAVTDAAGGLHVELRTVPAGASVLLGERRLGETPLAVDVPGPLDLALRHPGFHPTTLRVDHAGTFEVHLVPRPAAAAGHREGLD